MNELVDICIETTYIHSEEIEAKSEKP